MAGGEGAGHFKVGVAFGDDLALIKGFAPAREAELNLGLMAGDVEPQRDEGVAAGRDTLVESEDLSTMEQEFSGARRLMVVDVALRVWRDVHAVQPDLAVCNTGERVRQGDTACAQGFYLRSREDQSGFKALKDVVIEAGTAIVGDQPIPASFLGRRFFRPVPSSL